MLMLVDHRLSTLRPSAERMSYVPLAQVRSPWQLAFKRLIKSMRLFFGVFQNLSDADASSSITFFFNLWFVESKFCK